MKHCNKCGEDDQGAFAPSHKTSCKPCRAVYDKAYRLDNLEKESARNKKWRRENLERHKNRGKVWRHKNPEKVRAADKKWAQANREKTRAKTKKWSQENPHKKAAGCARRRAAKLQRTPVWHETEKVNQLYEHCAFLSEITGEPHEVDHVIPLQGGNVSGFHVWDNLQILPKRIHKYKGNAFNIEEYNA